MTLVRLDLNAGGIAQLGCRSPNTPFTKQHAKYSAAQVDV